MWLELLGRHTFHPFFEGVSERSYTPEALEKLNARDVEYDGRKYTAYEISQMQRKMERGIRATKRTLSGLDEAGFKAEFAQQAVTLKQQEARLKAFTRETDRRVDSARTQVQGFGRGLAQKAVRANKAELEKYTKIHYHDDGTLVVTDDWTHKPHTHLSPVYKPHAVVDTLSQNGRQRDRTIYDENGRQKLQISNGPHANPKRHPYGENGEHAHDIIWENGKIAGRPIRELTDTERKENRDIL